MRKKLKVRYGAQEGLAVNPIATRESSCTAPVRRQPAPTHEEMEKLEKSMAALEKQYTAEHPLVRPPAPRPP
jgi:hypothetical protein